MSLSDLADFIFQHGYVLDRIIGSGQTSSVYLATSCRFPEIRFAIKRIDRVHDDRFFQREMTSLSALDHPNVIKLYEYFEDDLHFYLVFEYCPEGSVMDRIVLHGNLHGDDLISYCSQIAAGLHYCHRQAVSHGDIKPQNILIDCYKRCKLADFGLAQQSDDRWSTLFLGSPAFMAPEIHERRAFNPYAADVWALGVTFYWMAAGESPWPQNVAVRQAARCGLGNIPLSVPVELWRLLKQMVEPDPDQRISISEVVCHPALQMPESAPRPRGFRLGKGPQAGTRSFRSLDMAGCGQPAPAPRPRLKGSLSLYLPSLSQSGTSLALGSPSMFEEAVRVHRNSAPPDWTSRKQLI
jgi:serine/threonine protein kinase